jgi:hypothetical protein
LTANVSLRYAKIKNRGQTFAAWGKPEEKPERVRKRQKLGILHQQLERKDEKGLTKTIVIPEDNAVSVPRFMAS